MTVSRRTFLKGAGGLAAAGTAATNAQAQDGTKRLSGRANIELSVNGESVEVEVEPRTTLLNALRNHAEPALTGTKIVCDRGTCGACTVMVDGEPLYSCMMLAHEAVGREVRTVEGLSEGGELSPLQEAFCEHDATMCGFCTPGFLMSLTACLERHPDATREQIVSAVDGNLCRCGTQPQVVAAALAARRGGAK